MLEGRPLYARMNAGMILADQVHVYARETQLPMLEVVRNYRQRVLCLEAGTPNDDDLMMGCCELTWRFADALSIMEGWKLITYSWINVAMMLRRRAYRLLDHFVAACRHCFSDACYLGCPEDHLEAYSLVQVEPRIGITSHEDLHRTLRRFSFCGAT